MKRNNDAFENRSEHRGGKFLPALCSVLGTLILISVILICIPVTAPKLMGYEIYDIVSGSMEPEIPVGSAVYVKAVSPEEVKEGDVIAFFRSALPDGTDGVMQGGMQGTVISDGTMQSASTPGDSGNASVAGADGDASAAGDGGNVAMPEDGGNGTMAGGPERGVMFQEEGAVIVHRVVTNQIVEGWFETKGDANTDVDMSKVPYDDLIGLVAYHIPVLGALSALLGNIIGKLYMICFAACGAMLNMLAGRMRK